VVDAIISCDCTEGFSNNKFWLSQFSGGLPADFDYGVVRSVVDAKTLILVLPNCDRGRAAVELHRNRDLIGAAAAYSGIMVAWDHDHREIIDAFGSPEQFVAALKDVAPLLDSKIPKRMDVWRGAIVSKSGRLRDSIGLSWTRNRDVACWFALRDYVSVLQPSLTPIVLHADIDQSIIVAMHGARAEQEVMVDVSRLALLISSVVVLDRIDTSPVDFERPVGDLCLDNKTFDRLIANWRLSSAHYEHWKSMLAQRRHPARSWHLEESHIESTEPLRTRGNIEGNGK
jgi:hypothetical protein